MQKCQECGQMNLVGAMVCAECGFPILKVGTHSLVTPIQGLPPLITGTAILSEDAKVVLEFPGFPVGVPIASNSRIVLGREDANGSSRPDVDLTPYGAFDKGVSRIHAALVRQDESISLLDLGSSNGTLVNGRRIAANQPRILQNGDEITFGQLVARVYFK